ncbi:uncharacterized protein LOC109848075 [Asparagus officinalis]|uniref:uncharacterized protein LOC109848075 n=1 Tax=Asparagus officinalis TaxID=4686 RepID=UPI00098E6EE0|nr:uncharacterized protein LOC109848075 [Asparagus officinalis]
MDSSNFDEFWAFYMTQHSKPLTRLLHFIGTLCSLVCVLLSRLFSPWLILLAPVIGYGVAWCSHFFVERNKPATFGHPFWALFCDFKMFGLMLTGRMDEEIQRLGKRSASKVF